MTTHTETTGNREEGGGGGRERERERERQRQRQRETERDRQTDRQRQRSPVPQSVCFKPPPSLSSVPKTADEEAAGDVSMTVKTGRSL